MADNIAVTPGSGASIAADEIAGALHQRVKITVGADGTNDGDVSTANPMPVVQTGTPTLPTGAATSAKQLADGHSVALSATDNAVLDAIASSAASIDGKVTACNTGAVVLAAGTAEVGKLAAGTALIGKVGIDQATANANEVVVKTGSTTAVTSSTAANCKVEATIAASQTVGVTHSAITGYGQAILDNADVTTARVLVAAVADKKFYITSIIFSAAAAGSYWLEDDDAAQITCKWTLAANGGVSWSCPIDTPFKSTTVNKGLKVKGSSAGVIGCMITYYTLA